jgi:rhodanese-related sulfurtransferase
MMKVFFTIGVIAFSSVFAAEPLQHEVAAAKEFLAKAPKPVVLDVRTAEEFSEGHLPGAVLVTIGGNDFVERVKKVVPMDKPVLVYCHSGGRSAKAIAALKAAGFSQLHELTGGVTSWAEEKQELIKP